MGSFKNALLSPSEHIIEEITATFEVKETFGVNYKFGNLIATDKRLILCTKYPLLGLKETTIYHYADLIRIDVANSLFSLNNDVSIVVKLVNKGRANHFLESLKLFSTVPGIRNFYQNSTGI